MKHNNGNEETVELCIAGHPVTLSFVAEPDALAVKRVYNYPIDSYIRTAFTTSPEPTTNGMLPKGYRFIEGDGIYLYKGSTFGAANTRNKLHSGFYASQIAQAMGLYTMRCELENWKDLDSYAKTRGTAYGISFESVCQEVMGPVQARQFQRLIGFISLDLLRK